MHCGTYIIKDTHDTWRFLSIQTSHCTILALIHSQQCRRTSCLALNKFSVCSIISTNTLITVSWGSDSSFADHAQNFFIKFKCRLESLCHVLRQLQLCATLAWKLIYTFVLSTSHKPFMLCLDLYIQVQHHLMRKCLWSYLAFNNITNNFVVEIINWAPINSFFHILLLKGIKWNGSNNLLMYIAEKLKVRQQIVKLMRWSNISFK